MTYRTYLARRHTMEFLEFSARRYSLRCVDWLQILNKLEMNCLNSKEKRKKDDQTNLNK